MPKDKSYRKMQRRYFHDFMKQTRFLKDGTHFTDFTLECEGQEFPVHKLALSASCPYFRDYFLQQENFRETSMTIDFMQPKILEIIVDYIYTGRFEINEEISPELLTSIIEASVHLRMVFLCHYCFELLLDKPYKNISLSDWKSIEKLNNSIINKVFWKFILTKLSTYAQSEEFLECSLDEISALVSCPEVADFDRGVLLQAIVNWIKHDLTGRKQHMKRLLKMIDFDTVNPVTLSTFKDEHLLLENKVFLKACSTWLFKKVELERHTGFKIETEITVARMCIKLSASKAAQM